MGISSYLKTLVINSRPVQLSGFRFPCFISLEGGSATGLVWTVLTSWPFSFSSGSWRRKWAAQNGASLNSETDSRGCPQKGKSGRWDLSCSPLDFFPSPLPSSWFLLDSEFLIPELDHLPLLLTISHVPWSLSCLFSDLRVFLLCALGTSPHQAFSCPSFQPRDSHGASEVPSGSCVFECALSCTSNTVVFFLTFPLFLTRLPSWIWLWSSSFRFWSCCVSCPYESGPSFPEGSPLTSKCGFQTWPPTHLPPRPIGQFSSAKPNPTSVSENYLASPPVLHRQRVRLPFPSTLKRKGHERVASLWGRCHFNFKSVRNFSL